MCLKWKQSAKNVKRIVRQTNYLDLGTLASIFFILKRPNGSPPFVIAPLTYTLRSQLGFRRGKFSGVWRRPALDTICSFVFLHLGNDSPLDLRFLATPGTEVRWLRFLLMQQLSGAAEFPLAKWSNAKSAGKFRSSEQKCPLCWRALPMTPWFICRARTSWRARRKLADTVDRVVSLFPATDD